MKYIIVGLGNFGATLAEKLTSLGHEVIGVDVKMEKVEFLKEKVTHTICLDCTDRQAVSALPLKDADIIMICIGENEGANIMATALMKQLKVKRLISRSVSALHEAVLEAMQVDEIIRPEEETAERWANKLNLHGVVDSFEITGDYSIVEVIVPDRFIGMTLEEADIRADYNLLVLTTIQFSEKKNILGLPKKITKVQGVASAQTLLNHGDIMVLYGNISDIKRLLKQD